MDPYSFLAERCFQVLTERMSTTRIQLWHKFQMATDLELAHEIIPLNSQYDTEEVVECISSLRTANAGDLGEFALFALGTGNVPLRASELTPERRDTLIKLELIAMRQSVPGSAIEELSEVVVPDKAESLLGLATKYDVSVSHINYLRDNQSSVTHSPAPAESVLPYLVRQTREEADERRMAQVCRLLSMPT